MSSTPLSLTELAHQGRFHRKVDSDDYDSYEAEYRHRFVRRHPSIKEHSALAASAALGANGALDDAAVARATRQFERTCGTKVETILQSFNQMRLELRPDPRDPSKVIYPLNLVMTIVLLARKNGCYSTRDIAQYYKEHYLELQLFLPDIPSPRRMLSRSTLRLTLRLYTKDELQALVGIYLPNDVPPEPEPEPEPKPEPETDPESKPDPTSDHTPDDAPAADASAAGASQAEPHKADAPAAPPASQESTRRPDEHC